MVEVVPSLDRRDPVRLPREGYPVLAGIETHLSALRPAQQRGLALWVTGTLLAGSGCQSAVLRSLRPLVGLAAQHALRHLLREWCLDGADKAAPGRSQVDVSACFAPLLGWVLTWWHGERLALALDATYLGERLVVRSVSVLSRGTAMPVAWHVTAANRRGPWREPALALLTALAPAVPPTMEVLVLADRGWWRPRRWEQIRALGWHPLLRLRPAVTFRPTGGRRVRASTLVPGPGHTWIGAGVAFQHRAVRRLGTVVVTWEDGPREPGMCLTDLAPEQVGAVWYGLRTWIALGFRSLKSVGWHGERTRRPAPARVARHWVVLAIATVWTVAVGTRVEDAERCRRRPPGGAPPASLRRAWPGCAGNCCASVTSGNCSGCGPSRGPTPRQT
jgi:hypothetical protein